MYKFLLAFLLFISIKANAQLAPDVRLKDPKDSLIALSSLKGKVVLVDFWATWCGPCRRANTKLKKIYNKYKSQGLEILSISVDQNMNNWKKVIKNDKLNWLHVIDNQGYAGAWNINYIPATFIIDQNGVFKATFINVENAEGIIKSLLSNEKPNSAAVSTNNK